MNIITRVTTNNEIYIKDNRLKKYAGQMVHVTVVPTDSAAYYQHKYYRGYLLPSIAETIGETTDKVHLYLKTKYLMQTIANVDEIPKKHLHRGIYVADIVSLINMEIGLSKYVTGCIIVTENNTICGYVPSLATVTYKEMKDYILQCETFMHEIGGSINAEGVEMRNRWQEKELEEKGGHYENEN